MGAVKTNANTRLKKDYTDRMLQLEMHKSITYRKFVPYQKLINWLFPLECLLVTAEQIFLVLRTHIMEKNPDFTLNDWWRKWLKSVDASSQEEATSEEDTDEGEAVMGHKSGSGAKQTESREDKL